MVDAWITFAIVALAGCQPALADTPPLVTALAVSQLSLDQADRHLPVKLTGTITYSNQQEARAFLRDETGSMFFRPPPAGNGTPELRPGDRVEIEGTTWRGKFSPSVAGDPADTGAPTLPQGIKPVRVRFIGKGPVPAAIDTRVNHLNGGGLLNERITLSATIHHLKIQNAGDWSGIRIELGTREGAIPALVKLSPGVMLPAGWTGMLAKVTGVVAGTGNEYGQFGNPWLAVESLDEIVPDPEATARELAKPPVRFRELFRHVPAAGVTDSRRVHVAATVTMVRPGICYYLGDGESGIRVAAPHPVNLQPGDQVDVAAYPARDEWRIYLEDGIVRVRPGKKPVVPIQVPAADLSRDSLEAALIRAEGTLVDHLETPDYHLLLLESGGKIFSARLDGPKAGERLRFLKHQSRLGLTGIREIPGGSETRANPGASFTVLLRSQADVAVVRPPPWLDTKTLGWLLGLAAGGLTLCAAWVALLRRQVRKQTLQISRELSRRTAIEERQRIARELHDSLEQELAGVNMHLDAAADWMDDMPPRVANSINRARAMLRHSRAEARRSILDLRSLTLERLGLPEGLREALHAIEGQGGVRPVLEIRGNPERLPAHVEYHLLRIAIEAAHNAARHAAATRVSVLLDFQPGKVSVTVRDDGHGFDPAMVDASRFGIKGMGERAKKMSGTFVVASAPGSGTMVSVAVETLPSPAISCP